MNVIQGRKPCARYRPLFDSYISNELLVETNHEILRHLEECGECAFELEQRSKTRELLRRSLAGVQASGELRSRIRHAVRLASPATTVARRRTGTLYLQIAAGLAIAAFSGLLFQLLVRDPGRLAALLDLGWNQHVHCTLGGHYPAQPDAREKMIADLGPGFAPLLPLAESKLPEYRIRRAHICRVRGRQFAHLILQKDATIVSVSILKKEPGENLSAGILRAANTEVHTSIRDQGEIVAFQTTSHIVYIMGNQTPLEMQVVAQRLTPGVGNLRP